MGIRSLAEITSTSSFRTTAIAKPLHYHHRATHKHHNSTSTCCDPQSPQIPTAFHKLHSKSPLSLATAAPVALTQVTRLQLHRGSYRSTDSNVDSNAASRHQTTGNDAPDRKCANFSRSDHDCHCEGMEFVIVVVQMAQLRFKSCELTVWRVPPASGSGSSVMCPPESPLQVRVCMYLEGI